MQITIDKSFILGEIRRTAEENGGKPLGAARFEKQTGLKRSDWEGVFRPRWGDALVEAGLSANQFQRVIESDKLVRLFAELAKASGHLPVKAELQMAHRNDSKSPSDPVFRRLGSKMKLIRIVDDWCKKHADFEDVLHWCEQYLEQGSRNVGSKELQTVEAPQLGHVYLMKSG